MTLKAGSPDAYDEMFKKGGYRGVYDLPVNHSSYYPLYKQVIRELKKHPEHPILEVGCGVGGLAELLIKRGHPYKGFDFSRVAIEKAVARTQRPDCFWVGNALDSSNYNDIYKIIVCTEVLEHVDDDLGIISLWGKGSICICSVPNFGSAWHVRFFENESDVLDRYTDLLEIHKVWRLKKPLLSDIALRNYVRQLFWNRYKPRRIMEILGLRSFEKIGGWFIFVGRKT
jgi:SAM-dependent methyltransferase